MYHNQGNYLQVQRKDTRDDTICVFLKVWSIPNAHAKHRTLNSKFHPFKLMPTFHLQQFNKLEGQGPSDKKYVVLLIEK